MYRREVLLSLSVASTVGCLQSDQRTPAATATDPPETKTPDQTPTANQQQETNQVTASIETSPDTDAIEVDATVVEQPTKDTPTTIGISLANTKPSEREFLFGNVAPFDSRKAENTEVYLLDDEESGSNPLEDRLYIPERINAACWKSMRGPSFADVAVSRELGRGETISNSYVLLADKNHPCPDSESVSFISSVSFDDSSSSEQTLWLRVAYQ